MERTECQSNAHRMPERAGKGRKITGNALKRTGGNGTNKGLATINNRENLGMDLIVMTVWERRLVGFISIWFDPLPCMRIEDTKAEKKTVPTPVVLSIFCVWLY